jgi:hypothetical protein
MENMHRSTTIRPVLLCIVILILAKLTYRIVFGFLEPTVAGIEFNIIERNPIWKTSWLFAVLMALLSLAFPGLWLFGNIVSNRKRFFSVIIIFLLMAAAIYLRHTMVRSYFTRVIVPFYLKKGQTHVVYPIDPVNFVYYMAVGLLMGLLISWLLLGHHKRD